MKKLLVMALMCVGMTAFAQEKMEGRGGREGMDPAKRAEMQVQKMQKDLGLNDSQVGKLKTVLTQQAQAREAKRAEMEKSRAAGQKPTDAQRDEMRANMQEERNQLDQQLKSILTPEQYTKWQTIRDERKARMGNNNQNVAPQGKIDDK
jgi:protein CpxP